MGQARRPTGTHIQDGNVCTYCHKPFYKGQVKYIYKDYQYHEGCTPSEKRKQQCKRVIN